MTNPTDATVLTARDGRVGRITLNRPRALNALDGAMIRSISDTLEAWRAEPGVQAVVLDGAGGRAFCAGGDVRALREDAIAGRHGAIHSFFEQEYALNLQIARYPKPYISLIDGICMGGGIGLSVHGSVRVATENALFAMPETGIALFPDVGASYALPRLRGNWGMFLGLTGARLGGADAVWAGLATHFVSKSRLAALTDALAADGPAALAEFAEPPPPGPERSRDLHPFAADSVAEIMRRLDRAASDWAQATLSTLRHASPSSLLWTFELLRRGAGRSLEECLRAELALTDHVTRHPDFAEGVRAMLVDKDRSPRWSPARLEEVDSATIAAMFA